MFVDFLFSICLLVVFSCSRLAFEYTWDCETGYSARSGLMTARDAKMSHDTGKQWACICMNPSGVGFGEWHILTATKSSWVSTQASRYQQPLRLCMRNKILRSANAKYRYSYLFLSIKWIKETYLWCIPVFFGVNSSIYSVVWLSLFDPCHSLHNL